MRYGVRFGGRRKRNAVTSSTLPSISIRIHLITSAVLFYKLS